MVPFIVALVSLHNLRDIPLTIKKNDDSFISPEYLCSSLLLVCTPLGSAAWCVCYSTFGYHRCFDSDSWCSVPVVARDSPVEHE